MDGAFHKNKLYSLCCVFALLIVQVEPAFAAETYEFYNGVRSLGMGGARVAVVNDETALLVNPASLGKLRDNFITLIDPELEIGQDTELITGTNLLGFLDPQTTLNLTLARPEKRLHQRAQLFPSLVFPNFGLGLYARYSTDAEVDATLTNLEMNYRNDYAAVLGFNFRLFDGRVKLGFNARAINRVEVSRTDIDATSTALTLSGLASEGFGVGVDTGLVLTAPWSWLPTLAAVYRDVGGTTYDVNDGMFLSTSTRPASTPGTVDVGLAVFPIMGKRSRSTVSVEYRDVLTAGEVADFNERLHYGFEINLADAFFVRGGMNQNYWTAGLELAMLRYQFQVATYGEEIGDSTAKRQDRRYVGKFAFRF